MYIATSLYKESFYFFYFFIFCLLLYYYYYLEEFATLSKGEGDQTINFLVREIERCQLTQRPLTKRKEEKIFGCAFSVYKKLIINC